MPQGLVWNEAALANLLTGPDGGVAADLARRAIRVETSAKQHASGRPGPNVITGRLRASITWKIGRDLVGLFAVVGTNVFYGPFVEKGTSRNRAYPYLRPALQAAR